MNKLMSKLKCNPLACLSLMFTVVIALFGWIKADISQIRQEQSAIYRLMIQRHAKSVLNGSTIQNRALTIVRPSPAIYD